MLAALLALVLLGRVPDSGAYLQWGARIPTEDMGGSCRSYYPVPPSRGTDSLVYHWRTFGIPVGSYSDSSARIARGDSVMVRKSVDRVVLYILYDWVSKIGPPVEHGCAKRRLLAPKMVP